MSRSIPGDMLVRLANSTPGQYAGVERALGMAATNGKTSLEKWMEPADEPNDIYRLGRGYKVWHLVYAGKSEVLQADRAVNLIEYLLKHPNQNPIHASELENCVDGNPLLDGVGGIGQAEGNSAAVVGSVGGVIEEATGRKLAGKITLPKLLNELAELRAAAADESIPEAEREEARKELTALLKANARGGKFADGSSRAADRVRKQIKTFIKELMAAEITRGKPNMVLRAFGKHLEDHLWLPSVGVKNRLGATAKPGCFTYDPPNGVCWRE